MENLIFILPILFIIVIVLFTPMIRKMMEADRLRKVNFELTNQLKKLTKSNSELTDEIKLLKTEIAHLHACKYKIPFFAIPPPEILYEDEYWAALTNWYRQLRSWSCESCGLDLRKQPYFLHTHHIHGRRHNDPKYLKALCIGCHAEQTEPYNHMFMKRYRRYKQFRRTYPDWKCKKHGRLESFVD